MMEISITTAGNVEIPAYLALQQTGYTVRWVRTKGRNESWFAEKDGCEFKANGPIELLGVVSMYETRGKHWKATDNEIDDFMAQYERPRQTACTNH